MYECVVRIHSKILYTSTTAVGITHRTGSGIQLIMLHSSLTFMISRMFRFWTGQISSRKQKVAETYGLQPGGLWPQFKCRKSCPVYRDTSGGNGEFYCFKRASLTSHRTHGINRLPFIIAIVVIPNQVAECPKSQIEPLHLGSKTLGTLSSFHLFSLWLEG